MRLQLLILATLLGLLGVPIAALGAPACAPCCTQAADPCAPAEGSCLSLGAGACCDAASHLPPVPAKRTPDLPAPLASAGASHPICLVAPRAPARRPGADPVRLPSPLRLSVVLLI